MNAAVEFWGETVEVEHDRLSLHCFRSRWVTRQRSLSFDVPVAPPAHVRLFLRRIETTLDAVYAFGTPEATI